MNYIEAPSEFVGKGAAVFLAGGISDCENWQSQVVRGLEHIDATVLNPRRVSFPVNDNSEHQKQIEWEYRHLRRATLVAFWFPPQTLCPIALFELGACCGSGKPLILGADPSYGRRFDLEKQIALQRPNTRVANTLQELMDQIQNHPVLRRTSS